MRRGEEYWIPEDDGGHTMIAVYREMLLHIVAEYPALPDPRELTLDEIEFFFEAMRPSLMEATRPR